MAERSFTTFTRQVPTSYPLAFEEVKLVDPTTIEGLTREHDLKSLNQSPESLLGEVFRLRERVYITCFGGRTLVRLEYFTKVEQIADVRHAIEVGVFKSKSSLRRFIQALPEKTGRFTIKDNKGVNIIKVIVEPNPNYTPPVIRQEEEVVQPPVELEDEIAIIEPPEESRGPAQENEDDAKPPEVQSEVLTAEEASEQPNVEVGAREENNPSLGELPKSIDELLVTVNSPSHPMRYELEPGLFVDVEIFDMKHRKSEVAVGAGVLTSGSLPNLFRKNGSIIIFKKRRGPAVILRKIQDDNGAEVHSVTPSEEVSVSREGQSERPKIIQAGDLPAGIDDLLSFVEAEVGPIHLEYEPGRIAILTLFDMKKRDSECVIAYAGLVNGVVWKRLRDNSNVIVFKKKNGPAILFQPIAANDNLSKQVAS